MVVDTGLSLQSEKLLLMKIPAVVKPAMTTQAHKTLEALDLEEDM